MKDYSSIWYEKHKDNFVEDLFTYINDYLHSLMFKDLSGEEEWFSPENKPITTLCKMYQEEFGYLEIPKDLPVCVLNWYTENKDDIETNLFDYIYTDLWSSECDTEFDYWFEKEKNAILILCNLDKHDYLDLPKVKIYKKDCGKILRDTGVVSYIDPSLLNDKKDLYVSVSTNYILKDYEELYSEDIFRDQNGDIYKVDTKGEIAYSLNNKGVEKELSTENFVFSKCEILPNIEEDLRKNVFSAKFLPTESYLTFDYKTLSIVKDSCQLIPNKFIDRKLLNEIENSSYWEVKFYEPTDYSLHCKYDKGSYLSTSFKACVYRNKDDDTLLALYNNKIFPLYEANTKEPAYEIKNGYSYINEESDIIFE